jgi:hypothetical protein
MVGSVVLADWFCAVSPWLPAFSDLSSDPMTECANLVI